MTCDNTRYALYAKVHGKTPDEMLELDRKLWIGGVMTGFILWNQKHIALAQQEIPDAFTCGGLTDHAAYDSWLERKSALTLDNFDNAQAIKEGWAVCESIGSSDGDYQIQRIDCQEDPSGTQLENDDEAWDFVTKKATEGSEYHLRALAIIENINPPERERIRKYTGV